MVDQAHRLLDVTRHQFAFEHRAAPARLCHPAYRSAPSTATTRASGRPGRLRPRSAFPQAARSRRRDRDVVIPRAMLARAPDRPCGWRSPIRAWRRTAPAFAIRSRISRPRARSSGLSEVTSKRPSSTSRSPLLSSFAGLATARSAQYRAATGSRFTMSPRSSSTRQHLRGKGMAEFGGLVQRLVGLGARHQRHLVEVAAIPGFVMFVDFVIGLGIALRGGLAQQRDGLRLLFVRHGSRHRDLEVHILGVRGEGHVAARAPQVPAAAQRRVADIFRRIFRQGRRQIRLHFPMSAMARGGVASPWAASDSSGGRNSVSDQTDRREQDRHRGDRPCRRQPAVRCGNFPGRNHLFAVNCGWAAALSLVAVWAPLVQIRGAKPIAAWQGSAQIRAASRLT